MIISIYLLREKPEFDAEVMQRTDFRAFPQDLFLKKHRIKERAANTTGKE